MKKSNWIIQTGNSFMGQKNKMKLISCNVIWSRTAYVTMTSKELFYIKYLLVSNPSFQVRMTITTTKYCTYRNCISFIRNWQRNKNTYTGVRSLYIHEIELLKPLHIMILVTVKWYTLCKPIFLNVFV